MNKPLNLFLALAFVAIQCFSILHNAEYAFANHQHGQQDCAVYLHAKNNDHSDASISGSSDFFITDSSAQALDSAYNFSPSAEKFSLAHPRAPPRSV